MVGLGKCSSKFSPSHCILVAARMTCRNIFYHIVSKQARVPQGWIVSFLAFLFVCLQLTLILTGRRCCCLHHEHVQFMIVNLFIPG